MVEDPRCYLQWTGKKIWCKDRSSIAKRLFTNVVSTDGVRETGLENDRYHVEFRLAEGNDKGMQIMRTIKDVKN